MSILKVSRVRKVYTTRISTLFAYEQDGKYFVEQPYQGIYEIGEEVFEYLSGE